MLSLEICHNHFRNLKWYSADMWLWFKRMTINRGKVGNIEKSGWVAIFVSGNFASFTSCVLGRVTVNFPKICRHAENKYQKQLDKILVEGLQIYSILFWICFRCMCQTSDFTTTTTTKLPLRLHLQSRLGLLPFRSRNLLLVAVFLYRI